MSFGMENVKSGKRRASQNSSKFYRESSNDGWISPSFESFTDTAHKTVPARRAVKKIHNRHSRPRAIFKNRPLQKGKDAADAPWVEVFTPSTKEELAVHHKKIQEVEEWLIQARTKNHSGHSQGASILLLTGPSGSGKTATIRVLAKQMQLETKEWSSSPFETGSNFQYTDGMYCSKDAVLDTGYETQTSVFRNFLLRANKYPSLFSEYSSRIVLVEEFPNVFLRDATLFHDTLRCFHKTSKCPIVFIVSDSTTGVSLESLLFPKTLQMELKVRQISFNPVAPTLLSKALNRISQSHICQNVKIEEITADSMGDIRSAINALQFMSMKKATDSSTSCTSGSSKRSSSNSLEEASRPSERDSSLFLFHALGKILHCKRDTTKATDRARLPSHLHQFERSSLLENPEEVFRRTSLSAPNFALFLHENYLTFTGDMEAAANSSSCFSQADAISAEWTGRDILHEYLASLATRGLMFSLNVRGTHSRWETLRKPQFYSVSRDSQSTCLALKNAFRETKLSLRELETELVPYLPKLNMPLKNIEQSKIVNQIGQMAVKRFSCSQAESLTSREAVCDVANTSESSLVTPALGSRFADLPDEEIEIEECEFSQF